MSRPVNVLILKSDEHNPRILSTGGHPFVHTPNVARLAETGVVFDNAYCPSPLCCPSRSSFISGRPVHEIQCYNNSVAVPRPNYPSYGGLLAAEGIHTVHVGKVDAYRPPADLGFAEVKVRGRQFRGDGDIHISREPLAIRPQSDAEQRAARVGVEPDPFHNDNQRMADALAFLDRAGRLGRPWTMEVNLDAPHFPHYVTEELWARYSGHDDLPPYGPDTSPAAHPYAADLRRHFSTEVFNEQRTRAHRRAYYGRVSYVDAQLGRLLDKLDETAQRANTIVVYTSDHGEMLGMFGMWFKSSMYEDSLRVPLIVSGPGFGRGVRKRTPVSQWDLGAALFEAVGVTRPPGLAGLPLQLVPEDDGDRAVFAEYHGHGTRGSAFLVRQDQWKFVYNAKAPHQLYDLEADPYELHNLADTAASVVRELTERLHAEFCDPELEQQRAERFIRRQLDALARRTTPSIGTEPAGTPH